MHAIDFRELTHSSRPLGPLDLKVVAVRVADVGVAVHGERGQHLSARLPNRLEVDARARRRRETGFLGELPLGDLPRVLAVDVLPLQDRPRPVVFLGPERSAGMPDQNLDDVVADPVRQQARAVPRHASDAGGAFQVLQRCLEVAEETLQVRHAGPAAD